MADTKKKKGALVALSSFTTSLGHPRGGVAVVTVIMAACGVEGIEGATLSGVLTAPAFGFQDAIGVCLFVMHLGRLPRHRHPADRRARRRHRRAGAQAQGQRALCRHPHFDVHLLHRRHHLRHVRGNRALLPAARRHRSWLAAGFDSLTGAAVVLLRRRLRRSGLHGEPVRRRRGRRRALRRVGIAVNQAIIIALGAISWLVDHRPSPSSS